MESVRPVVLTIAGLDPSGGAGLLADIKTFEQQKVYGLAICTAQTIQTEKRFYDIKWEDNRDILKGTQVMLESYDVQCVKIGIVKDMETLNDIVTLIHNYNAHIRIIIDTIFSSGTGFKFFEKGQNETLMSDCFSRSYLITPNYEEVLLLAPSADAEEAAGKLSAYTNVLLKGGHNFKELGTDYLYSGKEITKIGGANDGVNPKHGSGCVLSSVIAAQLACGNDLVTACRNAKQYITSFLSSNTSKLGYHYV